MTRRMQFGQEVPNFQSLYQSQVDRCTADNNAHIIDAVTLADCMQNGRSDLEAEHDEAYRAETKEYQGNVLNQLQFDNEILAGIATTDAEARFEQSLVTERGQLIQALQTAEGIGQVASGPLSMPVAP